MQCSQCGSINPESVATCKCGHTLKHFECSVCEAEVGDNDTDCPYCGSSLDESDQSSSNSFTVEKLHGIMQKEVWNVVLSSASIKFVNSKSKEEFTFPKNQWNDVFEFVQKSDFNVIVKYKASNYKFKFSPDNLVKLKTERDKLESLVQKAKEVSTYYEPSGEFTVLTFPVYLVLAIIAAFLVQIIVAVTDGVVTALVFLGISSQLPLAVVALIICGCTAGVCGYAVAGVALTYLINMGSKMSRSRSTAILTLFCVASALFAFVIRIYFTYYMATKMTEYATMDSPWDRPWYAWLLLGGGFITLFIASVVYSGKILRNNPYCEKCQEYMIKSNLYFDSKTILNMINDFKTFKKNQYASLGNVKWSSATNDYPNVELLKHECADCHDGHLKLIWHYLKANDKGKLAKNTLETYSDSLNHNAMIMLNNVLN